MEGEEKRKRRRKGKGEDERKKDKGRRESGSKRVNTMKGRENTALAER